MANAIDYATAKISPPCNNIIIQDKKIKIKVINIMYESNFYKNFTSSLISQLFRI